MSGHSKWANIQHRKGRQDAKRGKEFTKAAKEIIIAAKNDFAHAALAAHEQRIAKLLLQQLDLLADCRLRNALLLGGTGEIEVLCSR